MADVVVVDVVCGRYGTDPGISHCLETGYSVIMLRVYRPTYCIFLGSGLRLVGLVIGLGLG